MLMMNIIIMNMLIKINKVSIACLRLSSPVFA